MSIYHTEVFQVGMSKSECMIRHGTFYANAKINYMPMSHTTALMFTMSARAQIRQLLGERHSAIHDTLYGNYDSRISRP